jgi:hypothetical protein
MNTNLLFAVSIRTFETNLRRSSALRFLSLFVVGFLCTQLVAAQTQARRNDNQKGDQKNATTAAAAGPASTDESKKETQWDPSWSPLPEYGQPALPLEEVRETYAFAARHGELLAYVPCYCGCENEGHKSVLDCFVKGRSKTGAPKWDKMGFT